MHLRSGSMQHRVCIGSTTPVLSIILLMRDSIPEVSTIIPFISFIKMGIIFYIKIKVYFKSIEQRKS